MSDENQSKVMSGPDAGTTHSYHAKGLVDSIIGLIKEHGGKSAGSDPGSLGAHPSTESGGRAQTVDEAVDEAVNGVPKSNSYGA